MIKMTNSKRKYYWVGVLLPFIIMFGCSKDFLQKPPTSSIVDASFYKTDDQVLAGTALLYSEVWFDYNDKNNPLNVYKGFEGMLDFRVSF